MDTVCYSFHMNITYVRNMQVALNYTLNTKHFSSREVHHQTTELNSAPLPDRSVAPKCSAVPGLNAPNALLCPD